MTETWGRALFRAIAIALWIFALGVVVLGSAYTADRWTSVAAAYEADLDPRPRLHEMFPNFRDEGAPARAAAAAQTLKKVNHEYLVDMSLWAAVGVGLVAVPIVYRRRGPREARPSRRSWLLVVPILVVLSLAFLLWLAIGMGGALRGG